MRRVARLARAGWSAGKMAPAASRRCRPAPPRGQQGGRAGLGAALEQAGATGSARRRASRTGRPRSRRRPRPRTRGRSRPPRALQLREVAEHAEHQAGADQDERGGQQRVQVVRAGLAEPGRSTCARRASRARRRKYPCGADERRVPDDRGGAQGPRRRRLPGRRVDGAGVVPRRPARQAGAGGGPGRGRQDRAGQGGLARHRAPADPAPVLRGPRRGQGAVRVELPQAAAAHPDRGARGGLGGGQGRHLRRGLPARPAAAQRDHGRAAGGAADRRDRQDRPGVRGDAARGPLGLPDLDPRAGRGRGAHAAARAADLEQLARADRGAQAPLPLPLARLPERGARARDRAPARARSWTRRSRASWSR